MAYNVVLKFLGLGCGPRISKSLSFGFLDEGLGLMVEVLGFGHYDLEFGAVTLNPNPNPKP